VPLASRGGFVVTTYRQIGSAQLFDLCHALGQGKAANECVAAQSFVMGLLGDRDVPSLAPYPSRIGDDHSPYEYSVQFARGVADLRLLFEAQATIPNLLSNQSAALDLNERIARKYPVDFAQFERVKDLFCPKDPHGPFSLWHALCFDGAGRPAFKIYANPQVVSGVSGSDLMAEAVARLGLLPVAKPIIDRVVAQGGVPNYFSLDLAARLGSRVKLYFSHERATLEDLERVFTLAPTNQAGDVTRFCSAILGSVGSFARKPVCYCFSFVAGASVPSAITLHLPAAHYADSDASIMSRVSTLMAAEGLPVQEYQRAVRVLARRDLASTRGLQSYVSFRREASGLKLTVYLSPELFAAPVSQFPFASAASRTGSNS
jgi:DMATS type aromatic prenyltransferase